MFCLLGRGQAGWSGAHLSRGLPASSGQLRPAHTLVSEPQRAASALQASACVPLAIVLLAKASPMAGPGARVRGDHKEYLPLAGVFQGGPVLTCTVQARRWKATSPSCREGKAGPPPSLMGIKLIQ